MERGCHLELFMRECFERNGSAQNGSKASCKREAYPYLRGTVPYRTVPKSRVNAALDRFVEFRYSLACMNFLSSLTVQLYKTELHFQSVLDWQLV